jgi:hypothetical protein
MADESQEINPNPPSGPTPDPWHDSPAAEPADAPDTAADGTAAPETAAPETAAAEPETKKVPHPWHD